MMMSGSNFRIYIQNEFDWNLIEKVNYIVMMVFNFMCELESFCILIVLIESWLTRNFDNFRNSLWITCARRQMIGYIFENNYKLINKYGIF